MRNNLLQLAAFIFFSVGIYFAYDRYSFFNSSTEKVDAKVIENVEDIRRKGSKTKVSYYPIFQYTTKDGTLRTLKSNLKTNPPQYEVGEIVTLYYNPQNPEDARPYSFIDSWLIPSVFIFFGLLLFWISRYK